MTVVLGMSTEAELIHNGVLGTQVVLLRSSMAITTVDNIFQLA